MIVLTLLGAVVLAVILIATIWVVVAATLPIDGVPRMEQIDKQKPRLDLSSMEKKQKNQLDLSQDMQDKLDAIFLVPLAELEAWKLDRDYNI